MIDQTHQSQLSENWSAIWADMTAPKKPNTASCTAR